MYSLNFPQTFLHLVPEFPSDPFLFNSSEISIFQEREGKCLVCTLNSAWKPKYSTVPENNSDLVLEFHKAIGRSSLKDILHIFGSSVSLAEMSVKTYQRPFGIQKKGYSYA